MKFWKKQGTRLFHGEVTFLASSKETSAETDKIYSKFMPILRKWAKILRVKIVVDVPHGPKKEAVAEKENEIFVHFHSYPDSLTMAMSLEVERIFGYYRVPRQNKISTFELQESRNGHLMMSPEKVKIGFAFDRNLYIYPNLLTDDWENDNDLKIFSLILYYLLPRLVSDFGKNYLSSAPGTSVARKIKIAERALRQKLLKERPQLEETLFIFLKEGLAKHRAYVRQSQREEAAKEIRFEEEYYQNHVRMMDCLTKLSNLTRNISVEKISEDFEKIHRLEGVRSLAIIGNRIIIYTENITQTIRTENGIKDYDVGQFDIHIDANSLTREGIYFYQSRRLGAYKHRHAAEKGTCFGSNNDFGLNTAVDKLMVDFEIVPLVQLMLDFLRKEQTQPNEQPKNEFFETTENWKDQIKKSDEKFYQSVAHKEQTKEIFVALIEKKISQKKAEQIGNDIKEKREKITLLSKGLAEIRRKKKIVEEELAYLETKLSHLPELARSEFQKIISNESVVWLQKDNNSMDIYLSIPNVEEKKPNIPCLLKITFWEPLRLITPFPSLNWKDTYNLFAAQPENQHWIEMQYKGKIGKIVSEVKTFLTEKQEGV